MSLFKKILLLNSVTLLLTPSLWSAESFDRVGKNELSFFTYKPTYVGITLNHSDQNSSGETKYQFSFKYEILAETSWYLAYTQKTLWSTQAGSAPIKESNYTPEIFYALETDSEGMPYVQFGLLKYDSNGETGTNALHWQTHYVEPLFKFDEYTIRLTFWLPFLFKSEDQVTDDKSEIFDYYGRGELEVAYNHENGDQHSILYREGKKSGIYTLDYQWHINLENYLSDINKNGWNSTLFIEAFQGYGDTLGTFDSKTRRIVIGFSIVH